MGCSTNTETDDLGINCEDGKVASVVELGSQIRL